MVNSSLAYEILLYINSFYFGLFATCEISTFALKCILLYSKYDGNSLGIEAGVITSMCIIETLRLYLGRKGSLVERDIPVLFSVLLTVPSILTVVYLLGFQKNIIRIEYLWCTLMLSLQSSELAFGLAFILTMCRAPSYD